MTDKVEPPMNIGKLKARILEMIRDKRIIAREADQGDWRRDHSVVYSVPNGGNAQTAHIVADFASDMEYAGLAKSNFHFSGRNGRHVAANHPAALIEFLDRTQELINRLAAGEKS